MKAYLDKVGPLGSIFAALCCISIQRARVGVEGEQKRISITCILLAPGEGGFLRNHQIRSNGGRHGGDKERRWDQAVRLWKMRICL